MINKTTMGINKRANVNVVALRKQQPSANKKAAINNHFLNTRKHEFK